MIVALEGLPGAGKTTTAGIVAERVGARALLETTADHPFLQSVYDDERRHDLGIELAFLLLHASGWRGALATATPTLSDFSPVKDLIFADDMLEGDDRQLFETAYRRLHVPDERPELVVFLDVGPEECLRRARRRGRDFEAAMSADRLERLHHRYRARLHELGKRLVTLEVTPSEGPDRVADRVEEAIRAWGRFPLPPAD